MPGVRPGACAQGPGHDHLGAAAGRGAAVVDFSAGVPHGLPIGVQDEDHSAPRASSPGMLDATPGLHVARPISGSLEAQAALRSTDIYASW